MAGLAYGEGEIPIATQLDEAARIAVATVKESGANGLIEAINECNQVRSEQSYQDFKCLWLDLAGHHIDEGFSQAAGVKPKVYWSTEQMAARAAPAFKAAGWTDEQTTGYYKFITPMLYSSVDKYLMAKTPDVTSRDSIPAYDTKSFSNITANVSARSAMSLAQG